MAVYDFTHPNGTLIFDELADAVAAPPKAAWLHPEEDPVEYRRRAFEFPGADGLSIMRLGRRTQVFRLQIAILAVGVAGIEQIVSPIREAQDAQTGAFRLHSNTIIHLHCELFAARFARRLQAIGGLWMLSGQLTFRKLAPNVAAAVGGAGGPTGGKWGGSII